MVGSFLILWHLYRYKRVSLAIGSGNGRERLIDICANGDLFAFRFIDIIVMGF